MKRPNLILTALALTLLYSVPARAGLIVNGGFETPVTPSGSFTTLGTGNASMTPWAITAGSVDVVNNGYWPAYQGLNSLDLNGSTGFPGTISQTFATTMGATYVLTFAYANNADNPPLTAMADVTVTGAGVLLADTVTHSGSTRSNMDYTLYSKTFVADSATATLTFTDRDLVFNQGIVLDAVDVNPSEAAVPEPASLALLGLGALGLAGYGARRRKTAAAPAK
ncbi:MAG: choice-of-anchor C family protein [Gemmataceae bacterium]